MSLEMPRPEDFSQAGDAGVTSDAKDAATALSLEAFGPPPTRAVKPTLVASGADWAGVDPEFDDLEGGVLDLLDQIRSEGVLTPAPIGPRSGPEYIPGLEGGGYWATKSGKRDYWE